MSVLTLPLSDLGNLAAVLASNQRGFKLRDVAVSLAALSRLNCATWTARYGAGPTYNGDAFADGFTAEEIAREAARAKGDLKHAARALSSLHYNCEIELQPMAAEIFLGCFASLAYLLAEKVPS